jgi:hypothetical protein
MTKKLPLSLSQTQGIALLAIFALTPKAQANIGEAFGFGSRAASLAGASDAWQFDAFSIYTNPASASVEREKRLTLSYGFIAMEPQFTPINNVVTGNQYTTGQSTDIVGNVDMSYRTTFGQEIGLTYRLFPDFMNLTFGIAVFLPLNQLAYIDTGEAFVPEYVLYRSRTQRPLLEPGFSADLGGGFHVGIGLHTAFGVTANANVLLQANPAQPSTFRFSASMIPKASPYFGFLYLSNAEEEKKSQVSASLVIRLPSTSTTEMTLVSGARLFGGLSTLDFSLLANAALFYDPLTVELGASVQATSWARLFAQVDAEMWHNYQAPSLTIQQPAIDSCGGTTCGFVISPSDNPAYDYQNIVVPRVGGEFVTGGKLTYRVGYAYHASIFKNLPTGAGNYVDPPKHIFSAGIGILFNHFLNFDVPCIVDINGSYQALITQNIVKTSGNEAGNPADEKIGSPGYSTGGKVYGGGMDLTLAF